MGNEAASPRPGAGAPRRDGANPAPFFAPVAAWMPATDPRPGGVLDLPALNACARERALRTESGCPLRFVDARTVSGAAYERVVDDSGCVPTRTSGRGVRHDWFNALSWLAFPRTKARLNAVHAVEIASIGRDARAARPAVPPAGATTASAGGRRGRVRDVATLLDENGAVFLCSDEPLCRAFVERDWKRLFVRERARFRREVRVVVFGHSLFEKLLEPFKAICAHALVLPLAPRIAGNGDDFVDSVDAALADRLRAEDFAALSLHPLPLLGVPGWCPGNEDPTWYDDASVFRSVHRAPPTGRIAAGAGRTVAVAQAAEEGPDSTGQDAG